MGGRVAKTLLAICIALAGAGYVAYQAQLPAPSGQQSPAAKADGSERVARAYARRESRVWVELEGEVQRVLGDDRDGARHQRFVLELDSGQTLLVAHNIDLAARVPLAPGAKVRVRGRYEWNARGGVLHWTHHDPDRIRQGGWIEHRGRRYR